MDVRVIRLINELKQWPRNVNDSYSEIRGVIAGLGLSGDGAYLGLIKEIINEIKGFEDNYAGLIISVIINEFIKKREIEFNTDINAGLLFYKLKDKKITVTGDIKGSETGKGMSGKAKITANNINGYGTGWDMGGKAKITVKGDIKGDRTGYEMSGGVITVKGNIKGNSTGEDMNGGTITANNIEGSDTGQGMNGGTITANNIEGFEIGMTMRGGAITVKGNINGNKTGWYMTGGTITVIGDIEGNATGWKMGGGTITANNIKGNKTGWLMTGGTIKANNITGHETGVEMSGGSIFIKGDITGEGTGRGMTGGLVISKSLTVTKNFREQSDNTLLIKKVHKLGVKVLASNYSKDLINKALDSESLKRLLNYLLAFKPSKRFEKIIEYHEFIKEYKKIGINLTQHELKKLKWIKRTVWQQLLNRTFLSKLDHKFIRELKKGQFKELIGTGLSSADLLIEAYRHGSRWRETLRKSTEGREVIKALRNMGINTDMWDNPRYHQRHTIEEETTQVINVKVEQVNKLLEELKDEELGYELTINKETRNEEVLHAIQEEINKVINSKHYKKANEEIKEKMINNLIKNKLMIREIKQDLIVTNIKIKDKTVIKATIDKVIIKGKRVKEALYKETTRFNIKGLELTINGLLHNREDNPEYLSRVLPQLRDHWVTSKSKKNHIDNLLRAVKKLRTPKRRLLIKIWHRNARHDFKSSKQLYACIFRGGAWQSAFPNYLWDQRITFLDTYIDNLHQLRTFILAGKGRTLIVHGTEGQESKVTREVTKAIINTLKDYAKKCGFKTILISTVSGNPAKVKFKDETIKLGTGTKNNYHAEEITPLKIKNNEAYIAFEAFGANKPQKGTAGFIKIEVK